MKFGQLSRLYSKRRQNKRLKVNTNKKIEIGNDKKTLVLLMILAFGCVNINNNISMPTLNNSDMPVNSTYNSYYATPFNSNESVNDNCYLYSELNQAGGELNLGFNLIVHYSEIEQNISDRYICFNITRVKITQTMTKIPE